MKKNEKKEKTINHLFKYINSRKYKPFFIVDKSIVEENNNYNNYFIFKNYKGLSNKFTEGELYFCINPDNLEDSLNFIDNIGYRNGYSDSNYKFFTKVSKQEALLHFAKKKYPIGTIFKTVFGDIKSIEIDNVDFQFKDNLNATNNLCVRFLNKDVLDWATIYCDEKGWAEIMMAT